MAPGSVTRVLLQLRICHPFGGGNREEIEVNVGCRAGRDAALPRPEIRTAGEETESNEIRPAVGFPQQLASTLVENERQGEPGSRDVAGRVAIGSLAGRIERGGRHS